MKGDGQLVTEAIDLSPLTTDRRVISEVLLSQKRGITIKQNVLYVRYDQMEAEETSKGKERLKEGLGGLETKG